MPDGSLVMNLSVAELVLEAFARLPMARAEKTREGEWWVSWEGPYPRFVLKPTLTEAIMAAYEEWGGIADEPVK